MYLYRIEVSDTSVARRSLLRSPTIYVGSEEEVDIEETIDKEIYREDDYYNMFDRSKSRLLVLLFGTKGNIGKLPFIDFGKIVRSRTLRLEIIPELPMLLLLSVAKVSLYKALLLLLSIVKVSP